MFEFPICMTEVEVELNTISLTGLLTYKIVYLIMLCLLTLLMYLRTD